MINANYRILLHWVREREAIRQRKERGEPFPWTDDPILKAYRFCNVRREDDRVTRWIRTNIRERFAGHQHLWFMLCAARMINWPPTLQALIDVDSNGKQVWLYTGAWPDHKDFHPAIMGDALEDLKSMNLKVFTGAYSIPPGPHGWSKATYVAEVALGNLWRDRAFISEALNHPLCNLQAAHKVLSSYQSWGPFLAYQAVVDMRFTPLLSGASDVHSWCACGPGTVRGLNRLHGRDLKARPDRERLLDEVRALWPCILSDTGVNVDFSDTPNVCCEFDKYMRVKLGQGAPRARYVLGRGY